MKILEVFQQGRLRHMSAEDVYKELLTDNSDIGLATVYRVLMQFEQAGILKRTHFESGRSLFELNEGEHHDHLVCLQCGRVEEFIDPEIEKRQRRIARELGFALQDHALALYANCIKPDCEHRGG
jgi:Fur family ferric uptake transcriptional regulator